VDEWEDPAAEPASDEKDLASIKDEVRNPDF
jgi:hypothetical protein